MDFAQKRLTDENSTAAGIGLRMTLFKEPSFYNLCRISPSDFLYNGRLKQLSMQLTDKAGVLIPKSAAGRPYFQTASFKIFIPFHKLR